MKNLNSKLLFWAIIFYGFFMMITPANADGTKTIHIKVAAYDGVLFDDNFTVSPCPDSILSGNLTINAWCAIEQLAADHNWAASSSWFVYGVMLDSIDRYDGSDGNYWLWFSDSEPGMSSLNLHSLEDGESLLLTYGISPLKIIASPDTPTVNSTTTLSAFYFDINAWQWTPVNGCTFSINGSDVASVGSNYDLRIGSMNVYTVLAKKTGYLDSNILDLTPQPQKINIKLRIETASSTLFNDDLDVFACESYEGSGIYSLNGRCALIQSGLETQWSGWGSDLFLDSIDDFANNQNGNSIYWNWFENLSYGQTALNNHILSAGEELLLTYDKNPLKLSIATTAPRLGATTTLLLSEFVFDQNWNPVWQPAASSTFLINDQAFFSNDGFWPLFIATSGPYYISGFKTGYLNSQIEILNGIANENAASSSDSGQTGNNGSNGSGGSGQTVGGNDNVSGIDIASAVKYLISKQNSDGSIGSSIIYSDWAAIALSAFGDSSAKDRLKNYLLSADYDTVLKVGTTDLDRRVMALMALGVNPYGSGSAGYISKITSAFDGRQIGDPEYFNDDIFALFPLLKAGYTGSDPIISATVEFIISKQGTSGSWGSVDFTAAAIQALRLAQQTGNLSYDLDASIDHSMQKAREFLANAQLVDGSFGNNAFSTAWAVQAISALGESAVQWKNPSLNPLDYLALFQKDDGGFGDQSADADTRIWTTAYVIPAVLNKSWGDIIFSFAKPEETFSEDAILSESDATTTVIKEFDTATSTDKELPLIKIINTTEKKDITNRTITMAISKDDPVAKAPLAVYEKPAPIKTARQSNVVREKMSGSTNTPPISEVEPSVLGEEFSFLTATDSPPSQPILPVRKYALIIFLFSTGAAILLGLVLGLKKAFME